MRENEQSALTIIREWIDKAEHDLTAAAQILRLGPDSPTDTICFHAQQCVEKYLKTLLVFRNIPFPKTHKLGLLMSLIPPTLRPDLPEALQNRLTKYAVTIRYPDISPDIPLSETRKAVAVARRVRREVRRLLPKGVLRRRKRK